MRLRRIPPLDTAEHLFLALLRHADRPGEFRPAVEPDARDWLRIEGLATAHRLAGWLYDVYRDTGWFETAPADFRDALRLQYVQTDLLNRRLLRAGREATRALNLAGITPVLLKGGVLMEDGVTPPGRRVTADIDLLVAEEELPAADAALRDMGYTIDESGQSAAFYREHHFHHIYRDPRRPWTCLELHWGLSVPAMGVRLPIEAWRRRAVVHRGDGPVRAVFSPADFLLHLCLHTSLGRFGRLAQLLDIHTLLRHPGFRVDGEEFRDLARYCRATLPAAAALMLSRLFGDDPVREQLLDRLSPRPDMSSLMPLLRVENVLRRRMIDVSAIGRAVSLQRRDRRIDRWRYRLRQAWPSPADFGLDGHPQPTGLSITGRFFSWRGFLVLARMEISDRLARLGWELLPRHAEDSGLPDTSA